MERMRCLVGPELSSGGSQRYQGQGERIACVFVCVWAPRVVGAGGTAKKTGAKQVGGADFGVWQTSDTVVEWGKEDELVGEAMGKLALSVCTAVGV